MTAPTLLVTTSSFAKFDDAPLKRLQQAGYAVVVNPHGRKLTEAEAESLVRQHRPVGLLAGVEPLTRAVLEAGVPGLEAIARIGIGWDNVDHDAARELNIALSRTEGVLNDSVAELTLGMILNALRRLSVHDRLLRGGTWKKCMGGLLKGRRVGIVGFGAIGRRVGRLLLAFGATVCFHDPYPQECDWAQSLELDELLKQADIVSLHASGSERILGPAQLAAFAKPGAILVNTARGEMVDELALLPLLEKEEIAFACLDVYNAEPYQGPLLQCENALLLPHVGSYAMETRVAMEALAVDNLLKDLKGPADEK